MSQPEAGEEHSHTHDAGLIERLLPVAGLALMVTGVAEIDHGNQGGELAAYVGAAIVGLIVVSSLTVDVVRNRRHDRNPRV